MEAHIRRKIERRRKKESSSALSANEKEVGNPKDTQGRDALPYGADSGKTDWETAPYGVPFVKTGRETCAGWLYLGPFAPGMLTTALEEEIQFRRPYPLGDYRYGFWSLGVKGVSVRPYMDGIFFGQWFYAVQVGMVGLLAAAKALERHDLLWYFLDSVQVMADYFDYS